MSESHHYSLSKLTENLLRRSLKFDKILEDNQKIINRIKNKYNPRAEFNRWRSSKEGQIWKAQQHQKQQQCCAICDKKIDLKYSHIDHIQPISQYPELSLVTSNLQIACAPCNIKKSNSEV